MSGDAFRRAYAAALAGYLADGAETGLHAAYELGRDAVARGLALLELAGIHHDVLRAELAAAGAGDADRIATAGGDFFLESLSAYELLQCGLREAREAARLETRHAALVRQLSNFLADASLAFSVGEALEEMVQLVAEHARELVGAACCIASVDVGRPPQRVHAVSHPDSDPSWSALAPWWVAEIDALVRPSGACLRMNRRALARHPAGSAFVAGRRPVNVWLAAPLTALDGSDLGVIHVFDKHGGDFSETDEAVLVQLAQMAAATVERVERYASSPRSG